MVFPRRIYTTEELEQAAELVRKGLKHQLEVTGSKNFQDDTLKALQLVKTAGYYDILRTYIRRIIEIDGLTQLREADAAIWANKYTVENPVDAASLFIQKSHHMKEYLEGKLYFGGAAEKRSVEKRIKFLKELKKKSQSKRIKEECERLLEKWHDSIFF